MAESTTKSKFEKHHLIPRFLGINPVFLGHEGEETVVLTKEEHRERHKKLKRLFTESGFFQFLNLDARSENGNYYVISLDLHRADLWFPVEPVAEIDI